MTLRKLARQGFASLARGYGGFFGGGLGLLGTVQRGYDWNREAGVRYDNSIVYAAIAYAINALTEVDIYVRRPKGDGYEEVPGHPITELLQRPNPWYDGTTLISGWVISELAGRAGMSYTYKHRSAAGKLIGLEYLPHFAVRPYWAPGSGNFIDSYLLSVQGGWRQEPIENILEQRYGPINPIMPQVSVGPLEAVLLEIGTDKQAANFTAALLLNVGVTPHLISPALKDAAGQEILFGDDQMRQIEAAFEAKITGDNRGRPLVSSVPIKVDSLSFSPQDMNLEAIRNVSEERVCAVLRLPPLVLNLGTGLESTNNRASAEAAARQAARDFVKPYMQRKGRQLTRGLVPELGEPGDEVCFRIEAVEALQEDKTAAAKRDAVQCGGAWETPNEVRARYGMPPVPGGDELRSQIPSETKSDD